MDIGKEIETIVIEPLETPVPVMPHDLPAADPEPVLVPIERGCRRTLVAVDVRMMPRCPARGGPVVAPDWREG